MTAPEEVQSRVSTVDVLDGLSLDDRVQFDGKSTSWRVRAQSDLYTILTCSMFGKVYYTILDRERLIRGPMNIIGGGLGIFTTSGPDAKIDDAMDRLLARGDYADQERWEVSARNNVPIRISGWRRA